MAARRQRARMAGRRAIRRAGGFLQSIFAAIQGASNRTIGVLMLVLTMAVIMNTAKANPSWLAKLMGKIKANAAWKWLGDYLEPRIPQICHSLLLTTSLFLSTAINKAALLSLILSGITISVNKTTDTDVYLQCIAIFMFFAVRNKFIKYITIVTVIALIAAGHLLQTWNF